MSGSRASLWLRTARHVPPSQGWAWLRRRFLPTRPPDLSAPTTAPPLSAAWSRLGERYRAIDDGDPAVLDRAAQVSAGRFRFLDRELAIDEIDWSETYASRLWTYHLHYFDYAEDLARALVRTGQQDFARTLVRLWTAWMDAAGRGEARIEPYPTSVRAMNALRTAWLAGERLPPAFTARLLDATHRQLRWLGSNLEVHLGANHLQKNLAALAWGSLAFSAEEFADWTEARRGLWDSVRAQTLADGGHYERSPMYHAAALRDWLETLALARAAGGEAAREAEGVTDRLASSVRAFQPLGRPDGSFHLFNDAANGERPTRASVVSLARDVLGDSFPEPRGTFALPETGYYGRIDPDEGTRFVIDAGPPGPEHQPGHAHCDMLSFELDLRGRPLVVDAGLHGYDGDPFREYVRSTRAHNTVSMDGTDQHEMWATFRVARRGKILAAACIGEGDEFRFDGSCRPYRPAGAVHSRSVHLRPDGLRVTDRVGGGGVARLASWLHFHPDWTLEEESGGFLLVPGDDSAAPADAVRLEVFGVDDVQVVEGGLEPRQGWYCPRFGVARPAPVVAMRADVDEERTFGFEMRWT